MLESVKVTSKCGSNQKPAPHYRAVTARKSASASLHSRFGSAMSDIGVLTNNSRVSTNRVLKCANVKRLLLLFVIVIYDIANVRTFGNIIYLLLKLSSF